MRDRKFFNAFYEYLGRQVERENQAKPIYDSIRSGEFQKLLRTCSAGTTSWSDIITPGWFYHQQLFGQLQYVCRAK